MDTLNYFSCYVNKYLICFVRKRNQLYSLFKSFSLMLIYNFMFGKVLNYIKFTYFLRLNVTNYNVYETYFH